MYSVCGKYKCSVKLNDKVYYEIISLVEGSYSKANYIVVSNENFPSYQNLKGLGRVCKEINTNGHQIIMACNKYFYQNISIESWCRVS